MMYVLEHLWKHDLAFQHHLIPQLTATHHIDFDKVVLVEKLNEGLEALNKALGISADYRRRNEQKYNAHLKKLCIDRKPGWLKNNGIPSPIWFFDEETREIVKKVYQEDLELYGSVSA